MAGKVIDVPLEQKVVEVKSDKRVVKAPEGTVRVTTFIDEATWLSAKQLASMKGVPAHEIATEALKYYFSKKFPKMAEIQKLLAEMGEGEE